MKKGVSVLQLANISKRSYLDRDLDNTYGATRKTQFRFASDSNFFAAVYEVQEKIVLCFRGTDGVGDVQPDAQMYFGDVPSQYHSSKLAYKMALQSIERKSKEIDYLTGHSLGGGLAQMIGAEFEVPFVTFNAPGTKRSYKGLGKDSTGVHGDISMSGFSNRVGNSQCMSISSKWLNVRANGDVVSRATGPHIGDVVSIPSYCGHNHKPHWFWDSNFEKVKKIGENVIHQHSIDYLEPSTALWAAFKTPLKW